MSQDAAKKYLTELLAKQDVRSVSHENPEALLSEAKAAGFDFTADEWRTAVVEYQESATANDKLTEEELEAVAGGVGQKVEGSGFTTCPRG